MPTPSPKLFEAVLESTSDFVTIGPLTGPPLYVNQAARTALGIGSTEQVDSLQQFRPHAFAAFFESTVLPQALRDGVWKGRTEYLSRSGRVIPVSEVSIVHRRADGEIDYISTISRDISAELGEGPERAEAEKQVRRAQKFEAIGQLAGGLAHDFNNLLTIILGYCNTLDEQFDDDDPRREEIAQIRTAGERATRLTRQLLAFSRKQILQPVALNPADAIAGLKSKLEEVLGEDVALVLNTDATGWPINIDPAQFELVLVNLAANAHEAMPRGGRCRIETAGVDLDEAFCKTHVGVEPGSYVRISFVDTGVGIAAETRQRIFEPFFTTKARGKGPGLGLSTVFGIIKQSGGLVTVESELERGTTFSIYLPAAKDAVVPSAHKPRPIPKGTETVLVVEDQAEIRVLVQTVLKRAGYTMLIAQTSADAIRIASNQDQRIDLVVSDVIMPEMNGAVLFARLREIRPTLRALFMSGFAADVVAHQGMLPAGTPFLQKPFTASDLACKVREVLDEGDQRSRPGGRAFSSPA
jgi:two-component system cell cycle sensor histidine kinase/response regulator CckA